jgi:broad specificity phosphatase PhoE
MFKIMIIRHAEKPLDGHPERGVDIDGVHAHHELTVRGWQRAGALVRFFAPLGGAEPPALIARPRTLFATAVTPESPSHRPKHTLVPLAEALGVPVDTGHLSGEEPAVARAALAAAQPVLICWRHGYIPALAKAIAGAAAGVPESWPDDRFDLVWVLEAQAPQGPWRFSQVPQRLFARDRSDVT